VAVFQSPLFRKLLLSAFVLIVGTLLVLDSFLTSYITRLETQSAQNRLIAEGRILGGELEGVDTARVQDWAKEVSERSGTRITFVDPKGMVLADSERDPETMENHADRPEILQARHGQTGVSIRHSATLNQDLCYVALSIPDRGATGFILRLAVPLAQLDSAVSAVRGWLLGTSLIALAVSMLIAYVFSARLTWRIRRIQSFAERLPETRASQDLTSEADDELGLLSRSMNRMAAQLRESLDRLSLESALREAILSSMAEGVLAVDQHMHVTFCNGSFARLAGLTLPIPQHAPLLEVVRDAGLLAMLSQALASEKPVKRRLELPAAEGRSFEAQAAPLTAPSKQGAIAVLHDITDLERLEIVRKDFVANVSHELRTPLASIRGYAETLLDGALEDPENNRKFLEIIKAQAARLNNIASDLLMLSELESNTAEGGEPEHFSVHNVIENALRTVESEAHVRDVRLIRGRVEDAWVSGSKIRLEQALVNLLDNAIKFNRPFGEVQIDVIRVRDRHVRIMIADTGIGIPSGVQSRIFERFYRVDKARSRSVGGTGLGLSIVKHVLERMNGSITVESELGKGSVFTVTLPSGSGN
jgi:two-component system phosphate regulon sensor histidine kinase PhoR